ncbi:MAG: hypothetical protein ACKOA8_18180 [Deltaproteobacteria bacterium]
MSQHVPETCNESNGSWLPITEFSVKSGMSLSTIRRKIKSNSIAYRLERGKYLILFSGNETLNIPQETMPQLKVAPIPSRRQSDESAVAPRASQFERRESIVRFEKDEEDTFHMLTEAYEHALSERTERIKLLEKRNRELEDRLNELRLLVQVLEEKYEVRY